MKQPNPICSLCKGKGFFLKPLLDQHGDIPVEYGLTPGDSYQMKVQCSCSSDLDPRQLSLDWLDALKVVDAVNKAWVKPVYLQTKIDWCPNHILPIVRTYRYAASPTSPARYKAELSPDFAEIGPKVERVEVLCYVAASSIAWLFKDLAIDPATVARLLGCAFTATANIRERWRKIGVYSKTDPDGGVNLPSTVMDLFEDRPKCGWCKGPLVTGSISSTRADLHDTCHSYILTDVRPRLQAAKLAREEGA